jgi:hypothetical protein
MPENFLKQAWFLLVLILMLSGAAYLYEHYQPWGYLSIVAFFAALAGFGRWAR